MRRTNMKLSFSTKGWHDRTFDDFISVAKEFRFSGIELHNVNNKLFTSTDSAFHDYATASTLRKLYENQLTIPCIDSICDPADESATEESIKEMMECIRIAKNLHIPNIRVHAKEHNEKDLETVKDFLNKILPIAEESNVTLLFETSGLFCNTKNLRGLLETYACDSLSALGICTQRILLPKKRLKRRLKT